MTDDAANTGSRSGAASLLDGKQIAIVGAGPCGLTLARLLQQKGANVIISELESSTAARNQGGTLDLHEDSGQVALHAMGLFEQFLSLSRPEGQALKVMDKHGKVFVDLQPKDEKETRPEIDRGLLRGLLIDSLTPGTIQWGRQFERLERAADGRRRLIFADGPPLDADLVFGCDGTWSRVRPFVSTTRPYYCGVTFIEAWIASVDTRHPHVAQLVGEGTILVTGDDKAFIAQKNGDGNVRVYVTLRVPEDWTQRTGFDFGDPQQVRETLLKIFDGWAPRACDLLRTADTFIPRPLYTHPPRQAAWLARTDVTLLGDAAHVMPVFTGRGVNFAMLDAVELAHNLTSGEYATIPDAIRAYETKMLNRMAPAITETHADQDVFISAVAPAGVEDLLRRRIVMAEQRRAENLA
jgi:2-polyprenyl-6-methoxyphenol hydroxylase-like FAD-dependent oxidoreductase